MIKTVFRLFNKYKLARVLLMQHQVIGKQFQRAVRHTLREKRLLKALLIKSKFHLTVDHFHRFDFRNIGDFRLYVRKDFLKFCRVLPVHILRHVIEIVAGTVQIGGRGGGLDSPRRVRRKIAEIPGFQKIKKLSDKRVLFHSPKSSNSQLAGVRKFHNCDIFQIICARIFPLAVNNIPTSVVECHQIHFFLITRKITKQFRVYIRAVVKVFLNDQSICERRLILLFLISDRNIDRVIAIFGNQLIKTAAVICVTGSFHIRRNAIREKAKNVCERAFPASTWPDKRYHITEAVAGRFIYNIPHFDILQRTIVLNNHTKDFSHRKPPIPFAVPCPISLMVGAKGQS